MRRGKCRNVAAHTEIAPDLCRNSAPSASQRSRERRKRAEREQDYPRQRPSGSIWQPISFHRSARKLAVASRRETAEERTLARRLRRIGGEGAGWQCEGEEKDEGDSGDAHK